MLRVGTYEFLYLFADKETVLSIVPLCTEPGKKLNI